MYTYNIEYSQPVYVLSLWLKFKKYLLHTHLECVVQIKRNSSHRNTQTRAQIKNVVRHKM